MNSFAQAFIADILKDECGSTEFVVNFQRHGCPEHEEKMFYDESSLYEFIGKMDFALVKVTAFIGV